MRLTQKKLILSYVLEYGSITPAKMYGTVYKGVMLGSELSRRCRELRAEGKLRSEGEGKFERFYTTVKQTVWVFDEITGVARQMTL